MNIIILPAFAHIQENFKLALECLLALVCALKPLHLKKENSGSQYISFKHYEWKVQMDLHLRNIAKYGHVDYK